MGQIFFDAGDAQIEINFVVIGRDIAIANGPIFSESIAIFGFEIVVGEAERQASPDVGLAAQTASADPGIVGAGERILALVNNDVFYVVRVTDVTVEMLGLFKAGAVGRSADGVFIEGERMPVGREFAAMGIVVGPLHGAEFVLDG